MNCRPYLVMICGVVAQALVLAPTMRTAGADSKAPSDRSLVGTRLTYDIRYRSEGYTEVGAAIRAPPRSNGNPKHRLLGTLQAVEVLTILERRRTGGIRASVKFVKPILQIQVDAQSQPDKGREIAENLEHVAYTGFSSTPSGAAWSLRPHLGGSPKNPILIGQPASPPSSAAALPSGSFSGSSSELSSASTPGSATALSSNVISCSSAIMRESTIFLEHGI